MRWAVYSAVVFATGLVALFRYTLDRLLDGESHVLLPFVIPVMLGAWYAGLRCGLFATVLNMAVLAYYFAKPNYSFRVDDLGDQLRLELYFGMCVFISLVSEARHRYLRQIEVERIHVARRQRELESEVVERRVAEHRLQVSQTQFQLITDHAPVMLASATAICAIVSSTNRMPSGSVCNRKMWWAKRSRKSWALPRTTSSGFTSTRF